MVQWLRICLPMQGTRVRSLVWEDSPASGCSTTREITTMKSQLPQIVATRESPLTVTKTQSSQKQINKQTKKIFLKKRTLCEGCAVLCVKYLELCPTHSRGSINFCQSVNGCVNCGSSRRLGNPKTISEYFQILLDLLVAFSSPNL